MSNEWTRYHSVPTSLPRNVPVRKAPEEAHLAAEQAWRSSYCVAACISPDTNILVPILGPAVDVAFSLGRQKAAEAIRIWCEENDWKLEHGSGWNAEELYKTALGED